jgi:hypothetical protein
LVGRTVIGKSDPFLLFLKSVGGVASIRSNVSVPSITCFFIDRQQKETAAKTEKERRKEGNKKEGKMGICVPKEETRSKSERSVCEANQHADFYSQNVVVVVAVAL